MLLPLSIGFLTSACVSKQTIYIDPASYCAAVGTADHPGARYRGAAVPKWMIQSLRRQMRLHLHVRGEPVLPIAWRCAGGSVEACSVGFGMRCDERADTSRVPTKALLDFCRAFPNFGAALPTLDGRLSAYEWRCHGGWPHIIGLRKDLDAERYLRRDWFRVVPGPSFWARLGRGSALPDYSTSSAGRYRPTWSKTSESVPASRTSPVRWSM